VTSVKEHLRQHIPAGLYLAVLVAFLSIWHWKTAGHLTLSAVATFATFSWMALVYGDFFLRLSPLSPKLDYCRNTPSSLQLLFTQDRV
jgi:hypothetical protein